MKDTPTNFEFTVPEKPSLTIAETLVAIDKLPETIEAKPQEELSGENRVAVDGMNESEMAQYIQEFLMQYNAGRLTADYLLAHTMFQAVLARARTVEIA